MIDVETLLEETAAAYRAQVHAPVREASVVPLAPRHRPPLVWVAGVAAAAAAVAVVVGLASRHDGSPVASGPAATVSADEFDAQADALCRELSTRLAGVDVRFETAEAYQVVARRRLDIVLEVRRALPPPADDPQLSGRVSAEVSSAVAQLETAVAAADAGTLRAASAGLGAASGSLARAARMLELHGATECGSL
jgi:hypothetical protein